MKKILIVCSLLVMLFAIPGLRCGGRGGGGKKPPNGGNPPPPPPPPGEVRMTEGELKAKQRELASKMVMHPADRTGARTAREIANGGTWVYPPVDYWYGDVAMRAWAAGVPGAEPWCRQFVRSRYDEWGNAPQGSHNHQFASTGGLYFARLVLGAEGYRAAGGQGDPIQTMNNLLRGEWTCCSTERCVPEGIGCNPPWTGEPIGSRHYQQRTISDLWAVADCGLDAESQLARTALDRIVAFLAGKVRDDGIWPWPLIPFVRPERDALCYPWPDRAIYERYKQITGDHHPENTPYSSMVLLSYVRFNPDFQGHYGSGDKGAKGIGAQIVARPGTPGGTGVGVRPTAEQWEPVEADRNIATRGQGGTYGGCDERSENNDVGYLLGGQNYKGREGWRPLKTKP